MRLWTSLNWTFGILLFAVAGLWPVINEQLLTHFSRVVVEQVAMELVDIEEGHYTLNESYLLFTDNRMPAAVREQLGINTANSNFAYSAQKGSNGQLIIQARPTDSAIHSGWVPAEVLTVQLNTASGQTEQDWGPWGP